MGLPSSIDAWERAFSAAPLVHRHGRKVKLVAAARISMPPEPADRVHLALVDVLGDGVDRAFADETAEHEAENDLPRFANLYRHVAAAFEGRGRFGNARASHMNAFDSRKPRHRQFVDVWRKRNRADVHPRDQRVVDDIDGEL